MSAFFLGHPKETDLALFAGGEAGPFARWRIERHVETCKECEQTVADFFHLSDELSPLAEVPDVDWAGMARNIEARLALDTPEPEPRRGIPSWTWQLGAAAACALVAVAVWNVGPQSEMAGAPGLEEAAADKDLVAQGFYKQDALKASSERAEFARETEPPALQVYGVLPVPEPLLEKKKEASAEQVELALADRVDNRFADERFSTDAAAPPPPPARGSKPAPMEAEADLLVAQESRAREITTAGAPAPAAVGGGMGLAPGVVANVAAKLEPETVAFAVTPLPAAGEDVRVGADGWISVRSISADGGMTITDVYDPQ